MKKPKASKANNYHYNKRLKGLARSLRKHGTKSEVMLWKLCLKEEQLMGYEFLRQRPVLDFITDFLCKELMLVIELDGFTHEHELTFQKDQIKQKALEEVGFTILRFRDEEVLSDLENVKRHLVGWIENWEMQRGWKRA